MNNSKSMESTIYVKRDQEKRKNYKTMAGSCFKRTR